MADTNANNLRPRVLSGMRPTGKLHLGNYMGALANWVKLQDAYECFFFIADWHALTTDYADTSRIKQNTLDVALDYLAAGLDPQKSTIFIQSHVPQHAELHLLFSMITPLGWLERVPTYKEQQENLTGKDLTTYGFLGYPLLQAADILLYQPEFVPVGQDQVAHIELTREVARRFNSLYKMQIFPEPDALLTPSPKVPGVDGRKMSKSYGNTIGLTEAPLSIGQKIAGMSTNGQRIRQTDPGDPDLCPVGDLHKIFSSPEVMQDVFKHCRQGTSRCEICKSSAIQSVGEVTTPIHYARERLESNIEETWQMLVQQARKASVRAEETMREVRSLLGVSRDLGGLSRGFLENKEDANKKHDLTANAEWWNIENDLLRAKNLRDYWLNNLLPWDIQLKQESNRVFASIERELEEPLTNFKRKRVFVTAARERQTDEWVVHIPLKSYEIWTLLCWHKDYRLEDFMISQKYFASEFAQARKAKAKDETIRVVVRKTGEKYFFTIENSGPVEITNLKRDYSPLK